MRHFFSPTSETYLASFFYFGLCVSLHLVQPSNMLFLRSCFGFIFLVGLVTIVHTYSTILDERQLQDVSLSMRSTIQSQPNTLITIEKRQDKDDDNDDSGDNSDDTSSNDGDDDNDDNQPKSDKGKKKDASSTQTTTTTKSTPAAHAHAQSQPPPQTSTDIHPVNNSNNGPVNVEDVLDTLPECYKSCATTIANSYMIGCSKLTEIGCICSQPKFFNNVSDDGMMLNHIHRSLLPLLFHFF